MKLEARVFTSDVREEILKTVRDNPGINSFRIGKVVYGTMKSDSKSVNLISSHIAQMNKELVGRGLRIQGRGGQLGGYTLIEVEQ